MASNTLVQLFSALSDDTRLKIILALSKHEARTSCQELRKQFSLSQPAMSHHFRILKESKLVKVRKVGRHVYYSMNWERLGQIEKFMQDLKMIERSR